MVLMHSVWFYQIYGSQVPGDGSPGLIKNIAVTNFENKGERENCSPLSVFPGTFY